MYAAIDLGTNTFHMIIVDVHNSQFKVVYRKRHFVKLAYDSFEEIDREAMQRGLDAIQDFSRALKDYDVEDYRAYATSIFRIANNGGEYIELLKSKSGLDVKIISGSEEAKLIFYGAKLSGTLGQGKSLIMDIGGGSVEFILTDGEKILFENSYRLGILKLFHLFEDKKGLSTEVLNSIEKFLSDNTKDLQNILNDIEIDCLVGTAGSFDVLRGWRDSVKKGDVFEMSKDDFQEVFQSLANTSYEERKMLAWIPRERKKLIVFAFAIIDFALKISGANKLKVTSYSMKEGMIWEMINQKNIEIEI